MEKVKIFLVEDEIVIRNGIKNSIEWEKEGYEFAGEASDGELAYPMILEEKPDILITDIRMPFMDGLELSRLVKQELPDIKILILSGYDEFDYAKEAIRLGVTEYLLKPVTSVQLLKTLDEVSSQIRQEKEDRELLKKYAEDMKENTEQEKRDFFGQMISGRMSIGEIIHTGRKFGMNLSARMYQIVLFKVSSIAADSRQSENMVEAYDAVNGVLAGIPCAYSFQRGIDGWAFLMTSEDEVQMDDRVKYLTEQLKMTLKQYKDVEYFGGIGAPVSRLGELNGCFKEADRAFAGRFTHEMNQIISARELHGIQDMENLDVRGFVELGKSRELIENFLNKGTMEEVESFARAYLDEISPEYLRSTLMRQYITMDIYIVAMSFCEKLTKTMEHAESTKRDPELSEEKLKKEAERFRDIMQKVQSLEEIHAYIEELLARAMELRDALSGRRYSDIIVAAKEQIARTYMSEEISLNTVAVGVGMSPSYFSSVFSKEVGKTFVEYLTETRMEKAKELLMCSPMKTSEIGYEVGYKDPHYFSYIFKKTQGCSPKEYRARRKE